MNYNEYETLCDWNEQALQTFGCTDQQVCAVVCSCKSLHSQTETVEKGGDHEIGRAHV